MVGDSCASRDWQKRGWGPILLLFRSVPRMQSQMCQGTQILSRAVRLGTSDYRDLCWVL